MSGLPMAAVGALYQDRTQLCDERTLMALGPVLLRLRVRSDLGRPPSMAAPSWGSVPERDATVWRLSRDRDVAATAALLGISEESVRASLARERRRRKGD